ncbi:MAG: hypothetical protein U0990_10285 [Candidatus Nanopelagicales bacterium]|nr:hypothetical protein [Candidatus Nanopelagicales bacterium]MDZ4250462.1 hypothetical protein [Candidatus Nanopelagicales bacterium]
MAINPAEKIAKGLSRLGQLATPKSPPPEELGSRERVLSLVRSSPGPVSVSDLRTATGLHANTIREHLDVLLEDDAIRRELGPTAGRGRPPWLYSAGATETRLEALADALTRRLAATDGQRVADKAAEHWADVVRPATAASDPDAAVAAAADVLNRLGFRASANAVGDRIYITRCPHAHLVARQPAICDIHASLVRDLLASSGQPVGVKRLDVWARHSVCLIHLQRADIGPARSIELDGAKLTRSGKGNR